MMDENIAAHTGIEPVWSNVQGRRSNIVTNPKQKGNGVIHDCSMWGLKERIWISFPADISFFYWKPLWSPHAPTPLDSTFQAVQRWGRFGHWFIWTLQPQSIALRGCGACSSASHKSVNLCLSRSEVTAERTVSQIDRLTPGSSNRATPSWWANRDHL